MPEAGYSGTPLLQKLGIKATMKVLLINAPADYSALLGTSLTNQLYKKGEIPDFVHLFAANEKDFIAGMQSLQSHCKKNPQITIWVSWYKKSSGIKTDITEDSIRNYALKHGLVDVKVCAVSNDWSGLKLVVPLAKRK